MNSNIKENSDSNNHGNHRENSSELIGNCLDDFELLRKLGGGTFGTVFKVRSKKNQKLYALKKLEFVNKYEESKNKKEIILLKYLNHENICKCFSDFKTEDGTQYMVMELYSNIDLNKYVEANGRMHSYIKEEILLNIIFQCIEGLSYLHNKGIIHCDIKIGNIFMTEEGKIVLGDLGESMVKDPETLKAITKNEQEQNMLKYIKERRGSPVYLAPEAYFHGCDEKTDVYSLGVTFYALLFQSLPINEVDIKKNFENNYYSYELRQLIRKMIAQNKDERIGLFELKKEFCRYYYKKYIKNSGIHSVTQCLLSFINLRKQFSSNIQQNKAFEKTDSQTKKEKEEKVHLFLTAIKLKDEIEKNNYYLKRYFSSQLKINLRENNDISPLKIVFWLVNSLNYELNRIDNNSEVGNSQIQNKINKKIKLEKDSDIPKLYKNLDNEYRKHFDSIISNQFLGIRKVTWKCLDCNTKYISFERFFSIIFTIKNKNSQKINILDLFKDYNQKEFEVGLNKFVTCDICSKFTKQKVNKQIYDLKNNIIIMFDRQQNNKSEIEIKKEIKLNNKIVENFNKDGYTYILIGLIYENEKTNNNSKYIPIIKRQEKWLEFKYGLNLKEIREVNLDSILNNIERNVIALFYYKNIVQDFNFEENSFEEIEENDNKEEVQQTNNIEINLDSIETNMVFKSKNINKKNDNQINIVSNNNIDNTNNGNNINIQNITKNNNQNNNFNYGCNLMNNNIPNNSQNIINNNNSQQNYIKKNQNNENINSNYNNINQISNGIMTNNLNNQLNNLSLSQNNFMNENNNQNMNNYRTNQINNINDCNNNFNQLKSCSVNVLNNNYNNEFQQSYEINKSVNPMKYSTNLSQNNTNYSTNNTVNSYQNNIYNSNGYNGSFNVINNNNSNITPGINNNQSFYNNFYNQASIYNLMGNNNNPNLSNQGSNIYPFNMINYNFHSINPNMNLIINSQNNINNSVYQIQNSVQNINYNNNLNMINSATNVIPNNMMNFFGISGINNKKS